MAVWDGDIVQSTIISAGVRQSLGIFRHDVCVEGGGVSWAHYARAVLTFLCLSVERLRLTIACITICLVGSQQFFYRKNETPMQQQ